MCTLALPPPAAPRVIVTTMPAPRHPLQASRLGERVIIVGAGEQAEIAYQYLTHDSPHAVAGFAVEAQFLSGESFCGRPLVGLEEIRGRCDPAEYRTLVAVSSTHLNRVRRRLYGVVKELGYDTIPHERVPALAVDERITDFKLEWEEGYSKQQAYTQAVRCYQCQMNIFIDGPKCILCGGCVDICPYSCISMVPLEKTEADTLTELALAEAHGIGLAPPNPNGPLATAASVQLAASIPNLVMLETVGGPDDDALGRSVRLRVSANALKTVDHRGGLDAFLGFDGGLKAVGPALQLRDAAAGGVDQVHRVVANDVVHVALQQHVRMQRDVDLGQGGADVFF